MTDTGIIRDGVLIVGGYGHVGSRIAARLARAGQPGLRIAGRDGDKARRLAERLGCDGVALDLTQPAGWSVALAGIGTVVLCIDLPDAAFATEVLRRGLTYVDISATDAVLRRVEALQDMAVAADGTAVLSVGLAPGLSNLMAVAASAGLDDVKEVTIGVLLGLGDDHGAAAVDWTLDHLQPLARDAVAPLAFGAADHGARAGALPTIPFAFADQHVLRRRSGLPATTRLGFASPLVSGAGLRLISRLAAWPWFRRALRWSMAHVKLGSDRAALAVIATGRVAGRSTTRRLTLEGRAEAEITALIAATVVQMLPARRRPGVWHIHELWELADFAPLLEQSGIVLTDTPLDRSSREQPGRQGAAGRQW